MTTETWFGQNRNVPWPSDFDTVGVREQKRTYKNHVGNGRTPLNKTMPVHVRCYSLYIPLHNNVKWLSYSYLGKREDGYLISIIFFFNFYFELHACVIYI